MIERKIPLLELTSTFIDSLLPVIHDSNTLLHEFSLPAETLLAYIVNQMETFEEERNIRFTARNIAEMIEISRAQKQMQTEMYRDLFHTREPKNDDRNWQAIVENMFLRFMIDYLSVSKEKLEHDELQEE